MVYKGHVENGVIVLDEPAEMPEGMQVRVDFEPLADQERPRGPQSFRQRYADVVGKAKGLPEDAAMNHDHYLYGAPKRRILYSPTRPCMSPRSIPGTPCTKPPWPRVRRVFPFLDPLGEKNRFSVG